MPEIKAKHPLREVLTKYISEILIIFIGISISFSFDEWRENRKDEETARKHLLVLRSNLLQDTFLLTGMIDIGNKLVRSTNQLTYFKLDSDISDSINFQIDNAASYLGFTPNQTAYEEIKQTAHTNLIKNDSLKRAFLGYYTSVIPFCAEWCAVDKTHTMTQLIPEMSLYFPVVPDNFNLVSTKEKTSALKIKKIRNLLLMSSAYKQGVIKAFMITKEASKNLLKGVDDELKKQ